MTTDRLAIFTGNANPALAAAVVANMRGYNVALGKATVGRFSDGEIRVVLDENVRGADAYVIQPTCAPVNDSLMELLIMVDALRRASAGSITAVIPYYGYARQDRKSAPHTPITAKLVANQIAAAGVDRVVSLDLHAAQIQGFFDGPHDHLFAKPVLAAAIRERYAASTIVSPDAGGVERARAYSKAIGGTKLAIIDKRRERANESEVMHIIGDVNGEVCLIVDDMIDTGGTLIHGADALLKAGATSVSVCATHGVFSGSARLRLAESRIHEIIVTDTIPPGDVVACGKIRVVSVAPLLADAILRIHHNDSVSALFT